MGLKITISVIASLLALILIFLGVYFLWPWNKSFFDNSTKEFPIPGLDTKFCPQGMTRIDDANKYLISGYMTDGSPSRFYLIDGDTNSIIKYVTLNVDGKEFDGHVGGVTYYGSTIWTVSKVEKKGYCFRFLLSELNSAEPGGEIAIDRATDVFETYNNADFVFTTNISMNTSTGGQEITPYLWVGEFYRAKNYETASEHHLTTRSGETNTGVVYGFPINESYNYGIGKTFPQKAISVRGLCQGIAVTSDGKFVMSTSWGLSDSNIYLYDKVLRDAPHNPDYKVGLTSVPLWYLDNQALISTTNAPAMSEELFVKNNRAYILFESACKKYRIFNRKRLENVYSVPLTYLENQKNS